MVLGLEIQLNVKMVHFDTMVAKMSYLMPILFAELIHKTIFKINASKIAAHGKRHSRAPKSIFVQCGKPISHKSTDCWPF